MTESARTSVGRSRGGDPIARYFEFTAERTTYRREALGGATTFLAMAYILFVNPSILSAAGMDSGAVFTATALASIVGCLLMALVARYPVAVAPSMGLNAFFAYSVVQGMGIAWQTALVGVLLSGVLFVLITLVRLRAMILDAIPTDLKLAAACGIGLFIALIGLEDSNIIVADPATLVTLGDLTAPATLLTVFGLLVSIVLMLRRVPGAIFFGMLLTATLGIFTGVIAAPSALISPMPSVAPVFGVAVHQVFADPGQVFTLKLLVVVLTFLFVEFFDTAGTLLTVASKAGLMDGQRMKRARRAMLADSSSVVASALIGTSPTTAYIESTTGVATGARTGFASLITALLFVGALFFSPLLEVVTSSVTAPALIVVGVLMVSALGEIDWKRLEIAIPAFLTMIAMPLTYSIANGIALGLMLYPVTMVVTGRGRELHPLLYILFVIFLLYFAFLA